MIKLIILILLSSSLQSKNNYYLVDLSLGTSSIYKPFVDYNISGNNQNLGSPDFSNKLALGLVYGIKFHPIYKKNYSIELAFNQHQTISYYDEEYNLLLKYGFKPFQFVTGLQKWFLKEEDIVNDGSYAKKNDPPYLSKNSILYVLGFDIKYDYKNNLFNSISFLVEYEQMGSENVLFYNLNLNVHNQYSIDLRFSDKYQFNKNTSIPQDNYYLRIDLTFFRSIIGQY